MRPCSDLTNSNLTLFVPKGCRFSRIHDTIMQQPTNEFVWGNSSGNKHGFSISWANYFWFLYMTTYHSSSDSLFQYFLFCWNIKGIDAEKYIREDRLRVSTGLFTVGVHLIPPVKFSFIWSWNSFIFPLNANILWRWLYDAITDNGINRDLFSDPFPNT